MGGDDETSSVDNLIDANLRRVYDTVLQEEVPDRFARLLDQLRSGNGSNDGMQGDDTARSADRLQDAAEDLPRNGTDRPKGVE